MFRAVAARSRVCGSLRPSAAPFPRRRWRILPETPRAPTQARIRNYSSPSTAANARKDDDDIEETFYDLRRPARYEHHSSPVSGNAEGLVQNRWLSTPRDFRTYAKRNVGKAKALYSRIMDASSVDEYRDMVRHLDRLSDLLCRVLDLCDFVRMTHPENQWQNAATMAWDEVYQYMNFLNTQPGLVAQLSKVLKIPEVTSRWSTEERAVAEALKLDFEKSAVHLPPRHRHKFIELSQKISETGSHFVDTMQPETHAVDVTFDEAKELQIEHKLSHRFGRDTIRLYTTDGSADHASRMVSDPATRKRLYMALSTASRESIDLLEMMLSYRAELAKVTGFESYAHLHLKDRMMAKSPEAVVEFLSALQKSNAPRVQRQIDALMQAKREHMGFQEKKLHAWDLEFYKTKLRTSLPGAGPLPGKVTINEWLSLGGVMKSFSQLFQKLYGIRFVLRRPGRGEVWHPDVRRLDVVDEENRLLGVLYCDLLARESKSSNPAHYTIRCSREITEAEIAESGAELATTDPYMPKFRSPSEAANDGMATTMEPGPDGKNMLMQVPTIALVCSFKRRDNSDAHTLSLRDVETLYHEMGHAVHSFLARTRFQNVAGTRCATDLAEVPSTLMEHFATNPDVLGLWAYNWREPKSPTTMIPFDVLDRELRFRDMFDALTTERQMALAMFDQVAHSPAAADPNFSSTDAFHNVERTLGVGVPDHPATSWQGYFGHLHGYGSTYYSYLFDRVLSDRIWKVVFKSGRDGNALSRENGERLKQKLLKWGGSRDPWECMADVLEDDRIAKGDKEAMAIVGSWGIEDK